MPSGLFGLASRLARRAFVPLACAALLSACGATRSSQTQASAAQDEQTQLGVAPVIERAELAMDAGDYDSAIGAYQEALERTPWNDTLKQALVSAYIARATSSREGRGKEPVLRAEADLRDALVQLPGDEQIGRALAAVLLDRAAFEADDALSRQLRAEATLLAPDLVARTPAIRLGVERRLDLAFELIERGQLDAGIDELERMHASRPENSAASRLLAQALVRKGLELSDLRDHVGAAERFGRAVQLYSELAPCDGTRCDAQEQSTAHQNRVIAWLSARRWPEAERALYEAQAQGLVFPDLSEALEQLR